MPNLPPSIGKALQVERGMGQHMQEMRAQCRLHNQRKEHPVGRTPQVGAVVDAAHAQVRAVKAVSHVQRREDNGRQGKEKYKNGRPGGQQDEGEDHRRHGARGPQAAIAGITHVLKIAGQYGDHDPEQIEQSKTNKTDISFEKRLDRPAEEKQGNHVEQQVHAVGVHKAVGNETVELSAPDAGRPEQQPVQQHRIVETGNGHGAGHRDEYQSYEH